MTNNYTYEDFVKKANAAGMLETMSEADKKLALKNPDAGISILQYRMDYRNAATDEARALAHAGAEQVRSVYGGYSGGEDGNRYYLNDPTPADYTKDAAPAYSSRYDQQIADTLKKFSERQGYTSPYDEKIESAINRLSEEQPFAYSLNDDPTYQAYRKEYRREGNRAVADTMGSAAALTGGMPSSYAVTAANQAGDYYATRLTDKIPELEARAYERYGTEQNLKRENLNILRELDNTAYQRYIDEIGLDQDDLNLLLSLDAVDYEKFKDRLAQYDTDRSFDYNQFLDDLYYRGEKDEAEREQKNYENELALDQAESVAEGRQKTYENELERALYAAEYFGDYTLLKKLLNLS